MDKRYAVIYANDNPLSVSTAEKLKAKLDGVGIMPTTEYREDAELLVCIGGDGTVLEAVQKFDFPSMPIVGINTGHLGFFQELSEQNLDEFLYNFDHGNYKLQPLSTVSATVTEKNGKVTHLRALNEFVIRGTHRSCIHLNIFIGKSFIERFSGDGVLISTPAGSTAYNYSLGGALVDPRLELLQVTPLAPMNTTAYRSFTSSILLPSDLAVNIHPEPMYSNITYVVADGFESEFSDVERITVEYSPTSLNLIRFEHYDFWNKVKTKFL